MIQAPDPDARNSARYVSDLSFRAAADMAHARTLEFNQTVRQLRVPVSFVPDFDYY
ncbi:hypothetical protein N8608_03350 [bacterium]|nr:hypothetical protein [bacterium]